MVQWSLSAWISFLVLCGPWVWVLRRRWAIKQAIRDAIPRLSSPQPSTPEAPAPRARDQEIRI
jgi:hypothetical protein